MYNNYDIHILNKDDQWVLFMTTSWKHTADSVVKSLIAQNVTVALTPTMLRSSK